jgi:broad specificity phosphatase PhoE
MREGGFPARDEPLDDGGLQKVAGLARAGSSADLLFTAPERAARQTAEALGVEPGIEEALRDLDYCDWAGRSFAEVHAADPAAFAAWIADSAAGAPGGESFAVAAVRARDWLSDKARLETAIRVVAGPSIVRLLIASAIDIPMAAALRIDIAPLSTTTLSFNRGWRLQGICRA